MQDHQDDEMGYGKMAQEMADEEAAAKRIREDDEQARPAVVEAPAPKATAIVERPKQEPLQLNDQGTYITKNQRDEWVLAKMLLDAGAAPASFGTPIQVMVARAALRSLGLNPYTALRQCGYINGSFMVYGDLELALVRKSGQLEYIREFHYVVDDDGKYAVQSFENSNLHIPAFGAVCEIKRKDEEPYRAHFDQVRAKASNLWGRKGPWSAFPHRMMQMRARAEAIRNTFSDFTQGVATQEYDHEGIELERR